MLLLCARQPPRLRRWPPPEPGRGAGRPSQAPPKPLRLPRPSRTRHGPGTSGLPPAVHPGSCSSRLRGGRWRPHVYCACAQAAPRCGGERRHPATRILNGPALSCLGSARTLALEGACRLEGWLVHVVPGGQSGFPVAEHRLSATWQLREMAASGARRVLWHGRRWCSQMESAVPTQPPGPLYPPIVASATAKSKAAKRRRLEHFNQRVHGAASIEEKLRLYGKLQRPKYMVYPQTFALNADRWYRSFTKTVFVPGLPPRAASAAAKAPGAVAPEAAAGAAPEAARAPEPGTAAPDTAKTPAAGAAPYLDMGELRSLACDALLQESFYQNKKRPLLYRDQDHTPGPFLTHLVSTLATFLCGRNPLLAASSLGAGPGREVGALERRGWAVNPAGLLLLWLRCSDRR